MARKHSITPIQLGIKLFGSLLAVTIMFIVACIIAPALISAKSTLAVATGFALLALCVIVPVCLLWRLYGSHNKEGCCK